MSAHRRLCNWTSLLRDVDEFTLKNAKFRGWRVRYFRTGIGFDSEFWHNGCRVSPDDMTQKFLAALLQNEEWEMDGNPDSERS